ncbi:MAG TPA: hypothetical protein VGS13_13870 [Stellaceae bacterium]|nr:hypothetical protein [Stellaceae bacterium]
MSVPTRAQVRHSGVCRLLAAIVTITFWMTGPLSRGAGADELSLSAGSDFSSGNYGLAQSTKVLSNTLLTKYEAERWSVGVTLPHLRTDGPGNVIPAIGSVGNLPASEPVVRTGVGDLILAASYDPVSLPTSGTYLTATGKIRFGTAPVSRGLGTGQNSYYLQLEAIQRIGGDLDAIASFGRRFGGGSPDIPLRDVWYGSIGAGYKFSREFSGGLSFDRRQPLSDAGGPERELTLYVKYRITPDWSVKPYIVKGFATGSPSIGGGLVLKRAFSL